MKSSPLHLQAAKFGYSLLADLSAIGVEYQGAGVVSTRSFMRENPDILRRYLRAMPYTNDLWRARYPQLVNVLDDDPVVTLSCKRILGAEGFNIITVDKGEDADPDHVQEVPEQAQAAQASLVGVGQAVLIDLIDHHRHPQQAGSYVQTVSADQREERRQETGTVRAVAFGDQQVELVDLHADEARADHRDAWPTLKLPAQREGVVQRSQHVNAR